MRQATGRSRSTACLVVGLLLVVNACASGTRPVPPGEPAAQAVPRFVSGALGGTEGLALPVTGAGRGRLLAAADDLVDREASPSDPLLVDETDGPFVADAQASWTLALAGWVSGDARYSERAAAIVDAWVRTARSTEESCPDSGACSTSLMVSRAAPAMVYAVDLLAAGGRYGTHELDRFHRWLRTVILPAASERSNNWGDAGTFLQAVVGAELGDDAVLEHAAELWRGRMDLVEPDGSIPEEMRRGCASLMYSQDALDYKVAAADVLDRSGIDLWDVRGRRGGTLERALERVADGLVDPTGWPCSRSDLRIPDPSGVWAIAAQRWPTAPIRREARASTSSDGVGHSAVIWTLVTHPLAP